MVGDDNRGQHHGEIFSGARGPNMITSVTDPLCHLHLRANEFDGRVSIRSREAMLCRQRWLCSESK